MPKCKINGVEVEVKAGAMIIEAFQQVKSDIAHYCWHPGLSVAGVCRLCMVEIEGMPKLQIACNTEVKEGMVIFNNSEKVKESVRWGMDFHLINHPLDCPICDQAGECGLQEQYMKFGKYDPEMAEQKVKKSKVVDLGSKIVLDSERCILCSRCVRFTAEVSKTNEFGIFSRGDHSEIGTFENKPVENNYAINTVDICPVGALTSKDFRFRQRVWYLKNADTICTGCSTGCSVKAYYNEEGFWRVKPRHNPEVNGYWMCDKGRDTYKFLNRKERYGSGLQGQKGQWESLKSLEALEKARDIISATDKNKVAIVATGQYSNEEYASLFGHFTKEGVKNIYHWINNPEKMESFDGILHRGDENPNTRGLLKALATAKATTTYADFEKKAKAGEFDTIIVLGPENPFVFPDIQAKISTFEKAKNLIWMGSPKLKELDQVNTKTIVIPVATFAEKQGTYTNFQGKDQTVQPITLVVPQALSLVQITQGLQGQSVEGDQADLEQHPKTNFFPYQPGARV